jgi:hypothetical protein
VKRTALALLAGTMLAAEPAPIRGDLGGVASLALPQGYGLAMMEGPDFLVVHVVAQADAGRVLSVYLGNAPQFRGEGGGPAGFGPCLGRVLEREGRFDALVALTGPRDRPMVLHFFARDADAGRLRLAREIAASLALAPGFRCGAAK